jgi:hypothetical protein
LRCMVTSTPRLPYPRAKSPPYPFDRRLCGPQNWSRRCDEKEKSLTLPGIEPLSSSP